MGINEADIANAVSSYRPYQQFLQSAKHDLANVYSRIEPGQ